MSDGNIWVLIPLAAIIGGTIIKLKHGHRTSRKADLSNDETSQRMGLLTSQNAALQTKINDMELRVRTLEKIATDPSQRLAAEIERL